MDTADEIRRYFTARVPELSGPDLDAFIAAGRPLNLASSGFFCAPAARRHRLAFVHSGILRYHVVTEEGEDVTKDFSLPGSFAVSFGSAVRGVPAAVAISAVRPCTLTVWPFEQVERLYDTSAEWQRFGRRLAESLYVRKELRELSFLLHTASQRYAEARETFGAAVVEIPQYHLASYLGIAPETLSRLRGSRSTGGRPNGP